MRFLRRAYRTTVKPKSFPSFGLTTNSWDDYGTKCLFYLNYYPKPDSVIAIGSIKILQKDADTTVIPEDFEALDETFISLGQDIEFYQNLAAVAREEKLSVMGGAHVALHHVRIEATEGSLQAVGLGRVNGIACG